MNRKMELLYRRVEWLAVLDALKKKDISAARQEELTTGWKHILTDQFHDIIPGSSIHEVYEDSRKDYEYIEGIAREVENGAIADITEANNDHYTVFNASGWSRDEIIAVPEDRAGIYRDANGNELASQQAGDVTYVAVKNVPAMGTDCLLYTSRAGGVPEGGS